MFIEDRNQDKYKKILKIPKISKQIYLNMVKQRDEVLNKYFIKDISDIVNKKITFVCQEKYNNHNTQN